MRNVNIKSSKKLVGSSDIRIATPEGFVIPARKVGKKRLPAVPAGMGVFAKFNINVIDENGKKVKFRHPTTGKMIKTLEGPSHSFTRNFGQMIRGFLQNLDTALNTNETLTDDTGASFLCRLKGNAGATGTVAIITGAAKIKFGNSSTALSTTQTNLQGTLLGLTTEAAVTVTLTTEDSTNTIFTVTGQITNTTGSGFTVQEMGLFCELNDNTGATNKTTMVLRDLTGAVSVSAGQTIIGTYTFTIAV